MRVIVDGLSATSMSGRHVLLGHLEQLARFGAGQHQFFVLYHRANSELCRLSADNVEWVPVPDSVSDWKRRVVWQMLSFHRVIRDLHADLVFTPAGTILPNCSVPQVSLASNPWCLVPEMHQGFADRMKAAIQRRAYRRALAGAALMAYTSRFMQDAYRRNAAGRCEQNSVVAYPGVDEKTFAIAAEMKQAIRKAECQILAVSAMAPWKNLETLVAAFRQVRDRGIPATLKLVGPWPVPAYESQIRALISQLELDQYVEITGCVSREELHRCYAEATVFCLLSRCESFGIPALEAQIFGTPAVLSEGCAMPEVCGAGATSVPSDDPQRAADALTDVLEKSSWRRELSQAALENSARFRWSECSAPLRRMFEIPVKSQFA